MKTTHVRNVRYVFAAQTDAELLDQLDALVAKAARGDSRAVGAIAVAYGPILLREAEKVLGDDFYQEAEDVLQDFFVMLLEGRLEIVPAHGRAVEWMCGVVRSIARRYGGGLDLAWSLDDDEP